MAWIESHQDLGTHRKTMRLCTLMNIDDLRAVGLLHFLWWWALDNAPDGNLTGLTNKEIAQACHWKGKPDLLVNSLCQSGWIDKENESVTLHDWHDYAGKLVSKREQNKQRMRDARAGFVQRTCDARAGATVPNSTVQNSTQQKSKEDNAAAVSLADEKFKELVKNFEEFSGSLITQVIAEQLIDAEKEYGSEIIIAAFKKAAANGKRGATLFAYCRPIFEQYKTEGIPNQRAPEGQRPLITDRPAPEKYLQELKDANS